MRQVTAGLTAGLTPGLMLVAPRPAVTCAWCGAEIPQPRRGQRFCSASHRQRDYGLRRREAPAALYLALVGLTLGGLAAWHEIPPLERLRDVVDVLPAPTWRRTMRLFGLTWHSEERRWTRND